MSNKSAQTVTTVVNAGGKFPILQEGDYFYVMLATAPITIKPYNGAPDVYTQGTGKRNPPGNTFKSVELHNENNFSVVVSIFIGYGEYVDNRLIVFDPATQKICYPTAPVPNVSNNINIVDRSGQPITDINGNIWLALTRENIYFTNYDLATTYNVRDENLVIGTALGIPPATDIAYNINGNFRVNIPSGTINMVVSETYLAIKPTLLP